MSQGGLQMSDVDRVRDAADIVRIVGEHVALKAKGREYVGLCPFHDDHSPSMSVVPHKQIFHCFVCGVGGDVFRFVERYHRMDFREALEYLAERCNITLTPRGRPAEADNAGGAAYSRVTLADANAQASAFFRGVLRHEQHGRAARAVIERRGISAEMVERFGLGAAPDRWDGLVAKIDLAKGDRELFRGAGLLKAREGGGHYDTFRNRLMFPLRDQIGRVIAFGARRINDDDDPKYLNSPETPLFAKSASLFGLFQAVQAIQRERTAIVTEGYTDTIACHQAGFENVVATLGTALTPGHAGILRRLCDTIVLLFDGDEAGQKAADRAVEVFFAEPIDVRIATLNRFTDAKDPDELLKREGGEVVFRRAIEASVDLLEYRFARLRERLAGAGLSALERATTEEVAKLAQLGFHRVTPIRRQLVLRRLHQITGLDDRLLADQLREHRPRAGSELEPRGPSPDAEPAEPRHMAEALSCVLAEGALWAALDEADRAMLAPEAYRSRGMQAIARVVQQIGVAGHIPSLREVLNHLSEDGDAIELAVRLHESAQRNLGDRIGAWFADCINTERRRREQSQAPGPVCDDSASLMDAVSRLRRDRAQFGDRRGVIPRPSAP
ncbi:MAG: DNA primase [Phycisphaerales bacterium]|nr:DNA primase [Phycisphaerales bacterium]